MPDTQNIVINTGPLLALIAALNDLSVLQSLYHQVLVPFEVCQEVQAGGSSRFGVKQFKEAKWLQKWSNPIDIAPILINTLDQGEAAVIQLALNEKIPTVCIDEAAGRRMARLSGLSLTGSIGVLLRARREGHTFLMKDAIQRMTDKGIWLSERVITFALIQAGEENK
jgi:predicted nucleic acid-binding protein